MMAKTVLLIDDSKTQLLNSKFILQRVGYQVALVSDPLQALEQIIAIRPDLIITDINMPAKDGIAIIKEVRQLTEFADTPILVMSTDAQKPLFEQARLVGATGWLLKPFRQDDLLNSVKHLIKG